AFSSLASRNATRHVRAKVMNNFLIQRRERVARALSLGDTILVVGAGEPIHLPEGSDQTYPFRAHSEYVYLAGRECAGAATVYDPHDGEWIDFVPQVTEAERVWEGRT